MKQHFKKHAFARFLNEKLNIYRTKQRYNGLCKRYGTPSILEDPAGIRQLGEELWARTQQAPERTVSRPRVLFIGTDWEQDRSGMIQALSKLADVTLFEHSEGSYGQRWPRSTSEIECAREQNYRRLKEYLENPRGQGPFDLVIGQMWGLSMHWRALAQAREMGVTVVNLAMDDRHAFVGRTLADGSAGGTVGLSPYLSLACTDAPECAKWYQAEGCKAMYLPEASDPEIFQPMPGPKLHDVCFVGANYGIRAKLVTALERAGVKVQAYGRGWPNGRIPTDVVPGLFARSKIVLGCGTIGYCDDFLALKLRDFDGPTSGSLYITHDNPDLYPLFHIDGEIATFQSIRELVEKTKYLLIDDARREQIADKGRTRCLLYHTWEIRLMKIFSEVAMN